MMKRLSATPIFLILMMSTCFAQQRAASPEWQAFVGVGYWSAPSDLNDYYSASLDFYRQHGVPIPMRSRFGRTFSLDGGLLYSRISTIQIGLSGGIRYSPAYSSYEDFAGALKVNGSIYSLVVSLVVHDKISELWGWPLILTVEPGLVHSSVAITAQSRFNGLPQFNDEIEWTGSAWGFQFRGLLGTSLPVGPFVAGMHIGYQISHAKMTNGGGASGWMIDTNGSILLDQDGPILLLSLYFTL